MRKAFLSPTCLAVALMSSWLTVSTADAMKPFYDEFVAKYARPESEDARERSFAETVETTRCNVCHQGKTKSGRNPYGRALGRLLRASDAENPEKIRAALDGAAQTKIAPDDPDSPTFGQLIKAGKLPGKTPSPAIKQTGP